MQINKNTTVVVDKIQSRRINLREISSNEAVPTSPPPPTTNMAYFMAHTWITFAKIFHRLCARKSSRKAQHVKLRYAANTCVVEIRALLVLLPHFYTSCYSFFINSRCKRALITQKLPEVKNLDVLIGSVKQHRAREHFLVV